MKRRSVSPRLVVLLAVALAAVLIVSGEMARLKHQKAQIETVKLEIDKLNNETQNLQMCISQAYNLSAIGARAQELGMQTPTEDQIRVIRLPYGQAPSYAVSNTTEDQAQE